MPHLYKCFIAVLLPVLLFTSCNTSMKLAIPTVFEEQATKLHVNGARSRKISFGDFKTSKIKRGMHVSYPGWSRGFMLENLLLNDIGLQKDEHVRKEKDKFRFSLSDGKNSVEVFARETELTRSIEYKMLGGIGIGPFKSYNRLQDFRYIFSAQIRTDTLLGGLGWELMMSNIYDRRKDTVNSLFTMVKPDDNGLATNGKDTIFIKGLTVKKTETSDGRKKGVFPIKMLSGYELSTSDGVIAIIDVIDHSIWFYNELEPADRLMIGAISTAIFARRVKDVKW
jgi:hypothetical protein